VDRFCRLGRWCSKRRYSPRTEQALELRDNGEFTMSRGARFSLHALAFGFGLGMAFVGEPDAPVLNDAGSRPGPPHR
jgi:hypothetical protein